LCVGAQTTTRASRDLADALLRHASGGYVNAKQHLKTSEIELRQPLPVLECEWLVGRLLAKQEIETAKWAGGTYRLLVEYDADLCGVGFP